jgi:hypothetical protein
MTPRDFVYWLQGLFELGEPDKLNKKQVDLIKRHLSLVLTNETQDFEPEEEESEQDLPSTEEIEEVFKKAAKSRRRSGPRPPRHWPRCSRDRLVC